MGPRSHERGNGSGSRRRRPAIPSLQWGRVLTNAETKEDLKLLRVERVGFNGAAFSRTRKPNLTPRPPPTGGQLQWGRVLTNAETCGRIRGAIRSEPASMGPRSHERGNRNSMWRGHTVCAGFNGAAFSRTRKPIMVGRELGLPALCFNGAAFSRTRKRGGRVADDLAGRRFNGAAFSRTRKPVRSDH